MPRRSRASGTFGIYALAGGAALVGTQPATAQLSSLAHTAAVSSTAPFTFSADQVQYNRQTGTVTLSGHVEAWQNGVVLHADDVTYNRSTGEVTARGHIVLIQPDGNVMFADYAELSHNFRDGVFDDPRALLPGNGRLAGNGAVRTKGVINTVSRAVYSTCDFCKGHPENALLWQLRAREVIDDEQHQRIDYVDSELQFLGVPVAYMPYFWTPTPSAKRQSGLLVPSVGSNSRLGFFFSQPYYWVIDNQSDATFTPMLTSKAGEELSLAYRYRFNQGMLDLRGSGAYSFGQPQGLVNLNGIFDLNDTWRTGFTVQRTSSTDYVTNFRLGNLLSGDPSTLPSEIYLEGFGEGAYAKLDTRFYQSVNTAIAQSKLPQVLPQFQYDYFGLPDLFGGRLAANTQDFQVLRGDGTNTRRASLSLDWTRPFTGALGDLWTVELHNDAAAYNASQFNEQPNFSDRANVGDARDEPLAAVDFRWPFQRNSGDWGTQVIEPMAQMVVSPVEGPSQLNLYPNEDSLDIFNFTANNLFSLHRLGGIDRLEGGERATLALHGVWYLGGMAFDGLVGQSYRATEDDWLPEQTGLRDRVSDVVARSTVSPAPWLNITYDTRLSHESLRSNLTDVVGTAGVPRFNVSLGYIYSPYSPYYYYDQAPPPSPGSPFFQRRNEITTGFATKIGAYYRLSAMGRYDIGTGQMVSAGGGLTYEDECFIADLKLFRQFTTYNGETNATTVLFQFTLKTIGTFGFR